MSRYIDAEELNKVKFHPLPYAHITPTDADAESYKRGWNDALNAVIENAPTADVQGVKHGHWKVDAIHEYELAYGARAFEPVYKCSCCGRVTESYVRLDEPIMPEDADFPKWCGCCGAKMDGEEE